MQQDRVVPKKEFLCFSFLLCFVIFLSLILLGKWHNWGGDFSAYIMQAKAILSGEPSLFIDANRFTVEKSSYPVGPVAYPWGLPFLLVPFYACFGLDIFGLKMINILFFCLFVGALWFGFRRQHNIFLRVILILCFALNPVILSALNQILSDLPFLFFSTASLFVIGEVYIYREKVLSEKWDVFLLAILMAFAFFVRSNGILLIAVLCLIQMNNCINYFWKRDTKSHHKNLSKYKIFSPYVYFGIMVLIWRLLFPEGGSSHLEHVDISMRVIKRNIAYYLELPAEFLAGFPHAHLIFGASIPLAIAGMRKRWATEKHICIYIGLSMIVYLIWKHHQGLRFLYPLIPFYLSFCITPLSDLQNSFFSKILKYAPLMTILLFFGRETYQNYKSESVIPGPYSKDSQDVFDYIKNETDQKDVIAFFKPRVMRLYTERQSLLTLKENELNRSNYICYYSGEGAYDQFKSDHMKQLVDREKLILVYENPSFHLYKIKL